MREAWRFVSHYRGPLPESRHGFSRLAHSNDEERFKAIGRTNDGRSVLLVYTMRTHRDGTYIGAISARYMHKKEVLILKKKLPALKSDKQAEAFVANADLTEYDLSAMREVRFEFEPKSARINMRLPETLLAAVKSYASKAGMPYQRFIRQALETAVQSRKGSSR